MPLGSCNSTWNELLKNNMKVELAAQPSAPIRPQGFGSMPWRWPRPILHPSHRLVIYPSHRWFNPNGSKPRCCALCRWFLPSGFYLRHWALPSATGFYLPSLGSAPRRWALPYRRWVLPLIVGRCLPPLGCTLCRWTLLLWHLLLQHGGLSSIPLSSIPPRGVVDRRCIGVGHYVSSMGTMPHCWAVGGR